MLLELFNIRSGAVLDSSFGRETDDFLEITVQGLADADSYVTVDGVPADRAGKRFTCKARLTQRVNRLAIASSGQSGELVHYVTLLWDKKAFKRYNFALDDNVFFLTDIARQRPKSLFDHFYLAALREIHRRHGTCFTLNCFYRNDHDGFEIKDFPDDYKAEFEDNSDWLRLAFHAYSEFPDRPYQQASGDKLAADYELLSSEILRFAGERTLIAPTNIHWAMTSQDNLHVLRKCGMKVNTASFITPLGAADDRRPEARPCDVGLFFDRDVAEYLDSHHVFYDRVHDMILATDSIICNLLPIDRIAPEMDRLLIQNPYYSTTFGLLSHEQYSFSYYPNYIPDHLERLETAARHAEEAGYRPVFFAMGLLGNTAWD